MLHGAEKMKRSSLGLERLWVCDDLFERELTAGRKDCEFNGLEDQEWVFFFSKTLSDDYG